MSLPVRERGLKHRSRAVPERGKMSLPVRERGLKLANQDGRHVRKVSLPVRERGLKRCMRRYPSRGLCVAPRAGAWIETYGVHEKVTSSSRRSPCGSVD